MTKNKCFGILHTINIFEHSKVSAIEAPGSYSTKNEEGLCKLASVIEITDHLSYIHIRTKYLHNTYFHWRKLQYISMQHSLKA